MKYKLLLLLLISFNAWATVPVEIAWVYPTHYCPPERETPLNSLTWYLTQIIYDNKHMPMPSDTEGSCVNPIDSVPESATLITLDTDPVTSYTLQLEEQTVYYVRVRACYCRDFDVEYNCIYDVDQNGDWIFLKDVIHTMDIRNIESILNCSNWKVEQLISTGDITIPNPPIDFKSIPQ